MPRTKTPLAEENRKQIDEGREAFAALEPAIRGLDPKAVAPPRVLISQATKLVLGRVPRLLELRPVLVKACPTLNLEALDQLRAAALAALYANIRAAAVAEGARASAVLLEEGRPLRELLLRSAELMAFAGAVDADEVARIRAGSGNLDTAEDLVALAHLFEREWDVLEGKVPVTHEQVDRASVLGTGLVEALALEEGAPKVEEAMQLRDAAFALLAMYWEEVRRGVTYVRWYEGDAAELCPSLYAARRRRGPGAGTGGGGEDEPREDVEPVEAVEPASAS